MRLRQLGINAVEIMLVLSAPIARRQHAEQQDLGARRLDLADHRVEVGAHDLGVDAAQRVVGAERQDHEFGLVGERPIEPRQAIGRGVARDPGIDDRDRDALAVQPRFEPSRKRLARRQPQTRGQAVAKGEHFGGSR